MAKSKRRSSKKSSRKSSRKPSRKSMRKVNRRRSKSSRKTSKRSRRSSQKGGKITMKLINPHPMNGKFPVIYSSSSRSSAASSAFSNLKKLINNKGGYAFAFSMKDTKNGKVSHFTARVDSTGKTSVARPGNNSSNASISERKDNMNEMQRRQAIPISLLARPSAVSIKRAGGKKKSKKSKRVDLDEISSDSSEDYSRRRKLKTADPWANTLFTYDPRVYYDPLYAAYVFNGNILWSGLNYPLYPVSYSPFVDVIYGSDIVLLDMI